MAFILHAFPLDTGHVSSQMYLWKLEETSTALLTSIYLGKHVEGKNIFPKMTVVSDIAVCVLKGKKSGK